MTASDERERRVETLTSISPRRIMINLFVSSSEFVFADIWIFIAIRTPHSSLTGHLSKQSIIYPGLLLLDLSLISAELKDDSLLFSV